jgi:hypothetical protein
MRGVAAEILAVVLLASAPSVLQVGGTRGFT